jgi:hypothetical protein
MSEKHLHRGVSKPDGSTGDSWSSFTCGHCNTYVSAAVVARCSEVHHVEWLLCPNCFRGSVRNGEYIDPGVLFGPNIIGLPNDISGAYDEARRCMSVSALTACELICRKILMHVAVEKGAKEGETFASYLSHLESQGYITPPMRGWVDLIRQHGNKATHVLEASDKNRAESTLMFTAELLRLIYEMEYLSNQYTQES